METYLNKNSSVLLEQVLKSYALSFLTLEQTMCKIVALSPSLQEGILQITTTNNVKNTSSYNPASNDGGSSCNEKQTK